MRRRRQKNNLLPKMLGLAVLINAVLLPILAQFGVFKSMGGQRLTPIELIKAPPPEKRPAPPKKAPKRQAAKPRPSSRKAAPRTAAARRAPSGPPPIRVVASAGTSGANGSGGDSGIRASESSPAAVPPLPTVPAISAPPAAPPAPLPPPAPPVSAPLPAPPAPQAVPPHVPLLTAAAPLAQPRPAIPDDLRDTDLNASFEGLFTVHANGTATVKMTSSTGSSVLDSLALDAARRWTFRPATRDGQPIESYLKVRMEFSVSS